MFGYILLLIFLILFVIFMIILLIKGINNNHEDNNYQEEKEYKSEQERFGEKGEEVVSRMLTSIQNTHKYCLFNNFTYMYDDVHSTEIDHILYVKVEYLL